MSTFSATENNDLNGIQALFGESKEAKLLSKLRSKILNRISGIIESIVLPGNFMEIKKAVSQALVDSIVNKGEGSHVISNSTINDALLFLYSLPSDIDIPEITYNSKGGIDFEWYQDQLNTFEIVLNGEGLFYFAGLFGTLERKRFGREPIIPGSLPEDVLKLIRKIEPEK